MGLADSGQLPSAIFISTREASWLMPGKSLRRCPPGLQQVSIKLEILIDHAFGGKAFAGPLIGTIAVSTAQVPLVAQSADGGGQAGGVIFTEVKSGVAPYFPEGRNVVGYNRAARKCRFDRCHVEWFVARSGGVDCSPAIERAQLRFGLRPFQRDIDFVNRKFDIGAYRNPAGPWTGVSDPTMQIGRGCVCWVSSEICLPASSSRPTASTESSLPT